MSRSEFWRRDNASVHHIPLLSLLVVGTLLIHGGCRSGEPIEAPRSTVEGSSGLSRAEELEFVAAIRPEVERFCGDCHATPLPEAFPRHAWRSEVDQGYRFYVESGRDDLQPPPKNRVLQYYRILAPERLEFPTVTREPVKLEFHTVDLDFPDALDFPGVSHVLWHEVDRDREESSTRQTEREEGQQLVDGERSRGRLLFCDMRAGEVREVWFEDRRPHSRLLAEVPHPAHVEIHDLDGDGLDDLIVADLGSFMPGDHDQGRVIWLRRLSADEESEYEEITLLDGVGRVADVQAADLTGNGRLDLVVAEFGWRKTGRVLLLEQEEGTEEFPTFTTRVLDDRPGAIHVPIADLNGNGWLDIVALISQEHERVEAYLNQGDGTFQRETIYVGDDPSFGSSGIQLVDLNGSGRLDVLMTNGDTMDSFLLKPFHGVRWLENRGDFPFTHHLLAEMPGAYRALAADMTGNGHLDIVASAHMPERTETSTSETGVSGGHHEAGNHEAGNEELLEGPLPPETLIWLEQVRPGEFVPRGLGRSRRGHMAMALGDFDGDGHIDIAVGHFGNDPSGQDAWLTIWWGGGSLEVAQFGNDGSAME